MQTDILTQRLIHLTVSYLFIYVHTESKLPLGIVFLQFLYYCKFLPVGKNKLCPLHTIDTSAEEFY